MDVIELTRELGKAIQADERFIRFAKARLANDNDTDLQNAIGNFNIKRMELEKAVSEENKDEEKVKTLNEELRKAYGASRGGKPLPRGRPYRERKYEGISPHI